MATETWKSTARGGAWSNPANWSPAAPATGDSVNIGSTRNTSGFVVTEDNTTAIKTLTMAGRSGRTTTLTVTPSAILTVTGAISLGTNTIINGTGTLIANGAIKGGGAITANGGLLDISGAGSIASGGAVLAIGTAVPSTLEIDLSGGVTSGAIAINNANQTLEIGPSGSMTITAAQTVAAGGILMAGGKLTDSKGIVLTNGSLAGYGIVAANLTQTGGSASTITALGGTLDLTGSIGGGLALLLGDGATLKIDNAAIATAAIAINGTSQILEIGAAGALTIGAPESINSGMIQLDGGSLTDASGFVIGAGAIVTGTGSVTGAISGGGTVQASGGLLTLASNLTSTATTFDIGGASGSVLRLAGTAAVGTRLTFLGPSGVLELADAANGVIQQFNGTIAGLGVGVSAAVPTNAVNVQAAVTGASLSGSTITVVNGATTVATLALSAIPAAGSYAVVAPDGTLGGYDVFLTSNASPPPTVTENLVSDTGISASDRITANGALAGTADANAVVTVREGIVTLGTANVTAGGTWTFAPAGLSQGPHTIVASETNAIGDTGSASLTFTYDTLAPAVTEALANDTGTPGDNITTDPTLTGSGDPNAVVTFREGSTASGTTTANSSGAWTFAPVGLSQSAHTIVASETDAAGNTGSASLTFTLNGAVAAGGTISGSVAGPITLTGTLNPLTITSTGTVMSTGSGASGVNGASGTVWTVTNSGTIKSSSGVGVSLAGAGVISSSGLVTGISGFVLRGGGTAWNTGSIGGSGTIGSGNGNGSGVFMTGAPGTVTNGGIITGGAYGVGLDAGGVVTNTGSIIGGEDGLRIYGGVGTLTNSGTVMSTVDDGVGFFGGGTVTNNAGGAIGNLGTKGAGIYITGGTSAVVTNSGSISGIDYAVFLAKGGNVTNNAGGIISSVRGVHIQGATGTVTNSGSISGATNFGVRLSAGGQVTNLPGGSISGPLGIAVYSATGSVTNNGTISGTSHAITFSGSGANRLAVGAGSVIIGDVVGSTASGATNTLELAGGTGTLTGLTGGAGSATENAKTWAFRNFTTVAVDADATWTFSGKNTVAAVLNNGTIDLTGSLTVSTSVDPASTGLFKLEASSTLEVAAAVGTQTRMDFLGGSRLVIDSFASFGTNVGSTSYAGPRLLDFGAGDTIDIRQFAATSLSSSFDTASGILQITNGTGKASLAFETASLGTGGFHLVTDGSSGIFVTYS